MRDVNMDMSIAVLSMGYRSGDLNPRALLAHVTEQIREHVSNPVWIHVLTDDELEPYLESLEKCDPADKPLYGIPFAIKDNIDLAGIPTTAACAEYAYMPSVSAFAVQCLIDAGAIPVGKTNLDQFATGLVGTRSPYGAVRNAFNDSYIAGGSSSGSAVAVALGQVCFSLGTDTAGSGRIPAAFNNLVGLKPTRGRVSTQGVVPACRSLDCVSVFSLNSIDAMHVFDVIDRFDEQDCYARTDREVNKVFEQTLSIGVPREQQLEFFGNEAYQACFREFISRLQQLGFQTREIDFESFTRAAEMLYQGPWVAERYAAIEQFIESRPEALHPVTRQIIEPSKAKDAVAGFKAQYELQALKRQADAILGEVDLVCIPTAGTHYTLEELEQEPVKYNTNLGYYTNFMNLLDYAAIAVPAGSTGEKLPFGVTLFSAANTDRQLLQVASRLLDEPLPDTDAATGLLDVAVCGAHLSGMPLNYQLIERNAVLLEQTITSDCYRLYALAGGPPYRPGLIQDLENGASIEVEIWRMPAVNFGSFMQGIPHPLGIGKIKLNDGRFVNGFICEGYVIKDAEDITAFGGWRGYMAAK
ncbi:MAG: allophanate hydrolase [Gammaproteobacteria bacterium]